jgi:hypothetical protein
LPDAHQRHELESPFLEMIVGAAPLVAAGAVGEAILAGQDLDHQGWAAVLLLDVSLVVDEGLELLDAIEDRLEAHPGALPVLMKRGNSIVTEGCPRERSFLSKAIPSSTDSAEEPVFSAQTSPDGFLSASSNP